MSAWLKSLDAKAMHGGMTITGRAVRQLRARLNLGQDKFAQRVRALGGDATQSTISRWETGKIGDISERNKDALRQLAAESNSVDILPVQVDTGRRGRIARLSGLIGTGAEVFGDDEMASAALAHIEVPESYGDVEAFEVRGESMLPAYQEGDVLCCGPYSDGIRELIGELCLVRLNDGLRYAKVIEPSGEPGRYNLRSYNGSLIPNVVIVEAKPVTHIIKRRAVRYV